MITNKQRFGIFQFNCDCIGCDSQAEFDTNGDFYRAIEALKSDGWTVIKFGAEFEHRCATCSAGGVA